MGRRFLLPVLLLALTDCSTPTMRWEKPGGNAAVDEADCRARAHEEAIHQLPYGDGPPVWSEMGMNQWRQEIDNARYSLERNLTGACMHDRGYQSVPVSQPKA
jgi:hypothetical protein